MSALTIPDYLKNSKASSDVDAALTASMSTPRISVRGRVFRFVENGEEIRKVNDSINVVILGVEPPAGRMMKTFYEKGYSLGASEPPTCASHDGIAPSPWVTNRQSDRCDTCSMNKFGSSTSPSGKPSKRCRDSKLIIVSTVSDEPLAQATQYAMSISVSSLKALSEYARLLKSHNLPFASTITKIEMVDAEFPQVKFSISEFMPKEKFEEAVQISEARPWAMTAITALSAPEAPSAPALPSAIPAHLANKPATNTAASADDALSQW